MRIDAWVRWGIPVRDNGSSSCLTNETASSVVVAMASPTLSGLEVVSYCGFSTYCARWSTGLPASLRRRHRNLREARRTTKLLHLIPQVLDGCMDEPHEASFRFLPRWSKNVV
jgi:hypothetical protein